MIHHGTKHTSGLPPQLPSTDTLQRSYNPSVIRCLDNISEYQIPQRIRAEMSIYKIVLILQQQKLSRETIEVFRNYFWQSWIIRLISLICLNTGT